MAHVGAGERRGFAGEAKVSDLDRAVTGDQDVFGLDITVDESGRVSDSEGAQDRREDPHGFPHRQRARVVDPLAQGVSLDIFHDEADLAVFFHQVVDRHDRGVTQACSKLAFSPKPRQLGLVASGARWQYFDRDAAPETVVDGQPHRAHATVGDLPDESVPIRDEPAQGQGAARFDGRGHGGEFTFMERVCRGRAAARRGHGRLGGVTEQSFDNVEDLVGDWSYLPDIAERYGWPLSRVRRFVDEREVLTARVGPNRAAAVPTSFLGAEGPLPELKGTFTVLADGGMNDVEIIRWLHTVDPSLPGGDTPMAALRAGHKREIRRRAQALAF